MMPTIDNPRLSNYFEGIHALDPNPNGKKAVLLLHGLGADCESWPWQMEALYRAGFRPLALDLPGFGKSPRYSGRWTIAKTASVIRDFAIHLGLEQFSVAGISMGGTVALKLALDYPQLIDRLVLINSFARLKPTTPGQAVYFLRRFLLISAGDRKEQAEIVAGRIFPDDDKNELRHILEQKIIAADGKVYKEAMLSLGLFRVEHRLSQLSLPTLVISGELDTTVPLENQKKLASAIPDARHEIIPGGGHGVTVDHPEEVTGVMLSFLIQ